MERYTVAGCQPTYIIPWHNHPIFAPHSFDFPCYSPLPSTPVLRSADSLIRSITLRYHSYDAALVLNDILLPLQAAKRTPHRGCEISTLVSCRRKGLRSSSCNYARNEQPRGKGEMHICTFMHIFNRGWNEQIIRIWMISFVVRISTLLLIYIEIIICK